MKFRANIVVAVEDVDSIEVWDFEIPHGDGDIVEEVIEELNMGRIFPLDEDGVIIAPPNGLYDFVLDFNTDSDTVDVISRTLKEAY